MIMDRSRKILYIEDSLDDIELTLNAFKDCGLSENVEIVFDGHEAIDYLFYKGEYTNRTKATPCFVILDLKMQGLQGCEVLKAIRKNNEYKHLPVIMFSSSRLESDIALCYSSGVNAYVAKPIDYKELVSVIHCLAYFWCELCILPGNVCN